MREEPDGILGWPAHPPGDAASALFVLSSDAVMDRVTAAFEGQEPELIQSSLSDEEEAKLREVFSE